jgi:hypothetical protein
MSCIVTAGAPDLCGCYSAHLSHNRRQTILVGPQYRCIACALDAAWFGSRHGMDCAGTDSNGEVEFVGAGRGPDFGSVAWCGGGGIWRRVDMCSHKKG